MNNPQISELIRSNRQALGWSQDELAQRANIPQSAVKYMEESTGDVTWGTLDEALKAMGIQFVAERDSHAVVNAKPGQPFVIDNTDISTPVQSMRFRLGRFRSSLIEAKHDFTTHRRLLIQGPANAGKTSLAILIANQALASGIKVSYIDCFTQVFRDDRDFYSPESKLLRAALMDENGFESALQDALDDASSAEVMLLVLDHADAYTENASSKAKAMLSELFDDQNLSIIQAIQENAPMGVEAGAFDATIKVQRSRIEQNVWLGAHFPS